MDKHHCIMVSDDCENNPFSVLKSRYLIFTIIAYLTFDFTDLYTDIPELIRLWGRGRQTN